MACPACGFIAYVNPRLVVTTIPVTEAGRGAAAPPRHRARPRPVGAAGRVHGGRRDGGRGGRPRDARGDRAARRAGRDRRAVHAPRGRGRRARLRVADRRRRGAPHARGAGDPALRRGGHPVGRPRLRDVVLRAYATGSRPATRARRSRSSSRAGRTGRQRPPVGPSSTPRLRVSQQPRYPPRRPQQRLSLGGGESTTEEPRTRQPDCRLRGPDGTPRRPGRNPTGDSSPSSPRFVSPVTRLPAPQRRPATGHARLPRLRRRVPQRAASGREEAGRWPSVTIAPRRRPPTPRRDAVGPSGDSRSPRSSPGSSCSSRPSRRAPPGPSPTATRTSASGSIAATTATTSPPTAATASSRCGPAGSSSPAGSRTAAAGRSGSRTGTACSRPTTT